MKNYSSCSTPIQVNPTSTELAINLSSRSHLLTKTETFPNIKQLAASMAVAKIARPVTVQIYTSSGVTGSGVIIKRQGNIYTVLTASHLVKHTDAKYMIHTHRDKNYSATSVRQLQSHETTYNLAIIQFSTADFYPVATLNDTSATSVRQLQSHESTYNLAIIQFSTADFYPVATLNDTDENLIDTDVLVYGHLQTLDSQQREFELIKEKIIEFSPNHSFDYSTLTNSGMSGSPVFNAKGEVVGIYITKTVINISGFKRIRSLLIPDNSPVRSQI